MNTYYRFAVVFCALTMLAATGCDQEKAKEAAAEAEAKAEEAADSISKGVDDAVEKGKDAAKEMGDSAKELGEKAMGFLTPLKEKFGDLDSLKDKPEELKKAVVSMIETIEQKSADLELPESVSSMLATVKEKLTALKTYLEGEVEQSGIDDRLKEIGESMKGALGG